MATASESRHGCAHLRTDAAGTFIETFAAGFRNPYDIVFNREGELLTHDSDMEWDVGMPWYRPTRVLHVVPGGEYGWRSGWAPGRATSSTACRQSARRAAARPPRSSPTTM